MNAAPEPVHDDYATRPVPAAARRPMWEVLVIRLGAFACVPQLLLGSALGYGLTFHDAVLATLLGSVILQVLSVALGAAACAEGLSTSLLAAWAGFGRIGSALVGAVIAVALMGWFGVQNGVFASGLFHATGWLNVPLWSVLTGLAVTWITVKGYRLMSLIARIALPLFLVTVAWAAWQLLAGHSLAQLLAAAPAGPRLGLPAAITAVTGSFIIGAIVTPDLARFMRNGREVLWMTIISTFVGELTINLLAVAMALLLRTSDIVTLISTLAGGIGATIAVVSTVKLNNINLYSSSLGFSTLAHALRRGGGGAIDRVRLTWWIGGASTLLSMLGILDHFIGFLVLLGVAIPPIAGIMIVDYTLLRRDRAALLQARRTGALPSDCERLNPVALAAWLLACAGALLFPGVGIPAINALVIGSVAYGLGMALVGRWRGQAIARFAREAASAAH
jgi:cytosine permease